MARYDTGQPPTRPSRHRIGTAPRLLVAVMGVLLCLAPAPHRATAAPTVYALANGMTIVIEERPDTPAVGVTLAIRAGTRDDAPERRGETALLARIFLGGTPDRPSVDRLQGDIDATGGRLDLQVDADMTRFTAVAPAGDVAAVIDTLSDMLAHPRFGVSDLADAVDETSSGDFTTIPDTLAAALWPDHPAGAGGAGTARTRDNITIGTLEALRARAYGARNMVLAIVGPVDADAMMQNLVAAFGSLPAGERLAIVPRTPSPPPGERRRFPTLADQATVVVAFATSGRESDDFAAVQLLALLLTGPDGRLFQDLRSRHGLARDVDAQTVVLSDAGAILAVARVQPDNVDVTVDRLRDVFDGLRSELISVAELAALVERVRGALVLVRESSLVRSQELASTAVLGLPSFEERGGVEAFARVTPEDLRAAARRYFAPERAVIHVVTPGR